LLQAIASGDGLARGCVNIIGFESIRRSIGQRWDARREQVWDNIQKNLNSRLTPSDTVERIGEVEFLVFLASESGPVAQTVCLRALQEILTHYLGSFDLADLTIKTVTAVHGSALSCLDLDPATVMRTTNTVSAAREGPLEEMERKAAAIAQAFMVEVRGYRLGFHLEDIVSLRHEPSPRDALGE
jgi:GGDEF domain-containing protein